MSFCIKNGQFSDFYLLHALLQSICVIAVTYIGQFNCKHLRQSTCQALKADFYKRAPKFSLFGSMQRVIIARQPV